MSRRELLLGEMGVLPMHPRSQPLVEQRIPEPSSPVVEAKMGWDELKSSAEACTACPLHQGRNRVVVGVGNERADWLFIGEAPGAEEDLKGEPFVGQAGKLLDNMLSSIGLSRKVVYIANTVKCRPPGNRNPEPSEMAACRHYLLRQIELVEPKLIVILGRVAAQSVLETDATISSLRGRFHCFGDIPVLVTYHPAYLLRNTSDKAKAWADLCLARRKMAELSG